MLPLILIATALLPGDVYEFPDDQLSIDLRKLKDLEWIEDAEPAAPETTDENEEAAFDTTVRCRGRFGGVDVEVALRRDATTSRAWRPHHVLNVVQSEIRKTEPDFFFPLRMGLDSDAGRVSFLVAGIDNPPRGDKTSRSLLAFGGVTHTAKIAIEVRSVGYRTQKELRALTSWIAGALSYDGERRDPEWTDAEIQELWESVAPDHVIDDLVVERTEHYVILTNATIARDFSETMEGCYELIEDVFPAEERKGYRLLPVVIFRTKFQYVESYLKVNEGTTRKQANRTGGSCEGEYYLTYHGRNAVSKHIYLATQQYVTNRHWLTVGGVWFRVGVGEYLEEVALEREGYDKEIDKSEYVPLEEFMLLSTFALTTEGRSASKGRYDQAAGLVRFLVESRFGKRRYVDFLKRAGNASRINRVHLERILREVFDTDIAGLEEEFLEFWQER